MIGCTCRSEGAPPLTEAQRIAREAFDLDAALACLPPDRRVQPSTAKGQAGVRLRADHASTLPADRLLDFAKTELGAQRCAQQYLDALRVVLGNQAEAERRGHVLEMNHRGEVSTQRVMRTIIDQMQAAGITFGATVMLGEGRGQVVQCFARRPSPQSCPESALEFILRRAEAADDARRAADEATGSAIASSCDDSFDLIDSASLPY